MYFIIGGDGKQYGPISEADLRKWIVEGRLNQQSLARTESETEFRALATFSEFAVELGIAPPGIAPPLGTLPVSNEAAAGKVTVPAIGLIVAAILCLLEAIYDLISIPSSAAKVQQIEAQMQDNPQALQFIQKIASITSGPLGYGTAILQIIIAILILIGAIKMKSLRSYEFAYATAILSVIPCINPCCAYILSLIFGIWAMIVLSKPDVKSQFN